MLLKLSVVALTLASVFFMYTFYIRACQLEMNVLITNAMKNTPSPAKNEAPIYIERRRKQTTKITGYLAM